MRPRPSLAQVLAQCPAGTFLPVEVSLCKPNVLQLKPMSCFFCNEQLSRIEFVGGFGQLMELRIPEVLEEEGFPAI
jgi:hypothetical protein